VKNRQICQKIDRFVKKVVPELVRASESSNFAPFSSWDGFGTVFDPGFEKKGPANRCGSGLEVSTAGPSFGPSFGPLFDLEMTLSGVATPEPSTFRQISTFSTSFSTCGRLFRPVFDFWTSF